jgi:hypothetical protein
MTASEFEAHKKTCELQLCPLQELEGDDQRAT